MQYRRARWAQIALGATAWVGVIAASGTLYANTLPPQSVEDLRQLSIEELATVEITSVSKRPEPLSEAPAAVYVITSEDIRRSGAISLPEVLRLAPNLQVARQDAQTYAISARGFNTVQAGNKLLVLVDGRSIYTPLHAGVFWDQQQILLDDIERIEVISGPGGTLWGANAVNGVINIITKSARETLGGLATGQLGTVDQSGALRYGTRLGDSGALRVYGTRFRRGDSLRATGGTAGDDWGGGQAGARSDWTFGADAVTLQGDVFDSDIAGGRIAGGNLLGRWTRELAGGSAVSVQAYYDTVEREVIGVADELNTFDIEAQHVFPAGNRHQIVWGGGYRATEETFINQLNPFALQNPTDTVYIGNVFLQDSIQLGEDVTLTIGTKIEHSSYTGLEYLPSGRIAWRLSDSVLLWGAVSRAVRTPSRIDRDLTAPGLLEPASDLESEELIAYEVGYRGRPTANTSLSVSLFYNDYDDLRVLTVSPTSGLLVFGNRMAGYTYGLEAWGDWTVRPWWRLSAGFNVLEKRLHLEPGAVDLALSQHRGNDPEYQASLRSSMNLTDQIELDIGLRVVDELPEPAIPGYVEIDARLAWHVSDGLELSVAGFSLLDSQHPETGDLATLREVRRGVYVGARWRF